MTTNRLPACATWLLSCRSASPIWRVFDKPMSEVLMEAIGDAAELALLAQLNAAAGARLHPA